MGLNAKQKEAVEYLDGPLLVLAGPGTGKTQLLSEKVAYILKNTDTSPENILCVTFTETGAANMRERLKTIVGRDAMKVNISTYHVLGQEILAKYQGYSENYGRRLTEVVDEVTQFKLVKAILMRLQGTDILRGDNVKDVISVISEAKVAGLTPTDLETVARQNLEDSRVISEAISPLLLNIVPRQFQASYERAYQPIFEILKDYADGMTTVPGVKTIERNIAVLARDLKTAIVEAESTQSIKPLSAWKDAYFERDEQGAYRLRDRVANKKLLSIAGVMREYEEALRQAGQYDFDDMIEEAVKVLREDEGFRLTLSERYQVIMLDEFQDTNPSQFMIIKELTRYEKPLVMAVGDDDQAIYEFQGALSTNLTDFQRHYAAHVIALVENYRSTQEVLDFSHEIIAQAPDRFADKTLTAHKPDPATSQITRQEFLSSDQEYAFVASEVARLVRSGVKQSEIAIISYKTKYFMPLLPFLKEYPEVKIAYEKKDNLLEDEAMHEILTICRFVDELSRETRVDTSLLEILAYPCFNLPMLEVLKCAGKAKTNHEPMLDVVGASEIAGLTEVARFLGDLVARAFNEPVESFLNYVIGAAPLNGYRSPILKYFTGADEYRTFTFYENLAALKGKLVRHFGEKPLRLHDLIEMVTDYEAAEMALNTTSPYREADEAVAILSAHKAKGLEFEHVFLISADHTAWGKGKGNNNLLALPKNLAQIRHTGTTDGEKLRILYVALTRAKSHLYITNSLHDFNDKSPDRLEYLEEYVENGEVISPFLPSRKVVLNYEAGASEIAGLTGENARVKALSNWLAPYAAENPDMRAIYKERVLNYRLSATGLTSFIDIVYAGPVEFFKNYVLQAPREPETEQLAYGTLIHAAFEATTNQGLDKTGAVELYLKELEKLDLEPEVKRALREKGPRDLDIAISSFGEILKNGRAEVNFGPEKLTIDGVPVTGKIDHLAIDEEKKTIEVYDFKTGGYHKEKWESHATLYKYMLQLEFYKLLLKASPTYNKYTVEKAHILFVSPDKDGAVHDKTYEYTAESEAAARELVAAVYGEIASLDFMDDPEIFLEKDEGRNLKDIKAFVELIESKKGLKS